MANLLTFAVVFLLTQTQASAQPCTSGFLNPLAEDLDFAIRKAIVPLLGRGEMHDAEQWIFPNMKFTCAGRITNWIFGGVPSVQNAASECRVHLTTWRLDSLTSSFITRYIRMSTTERNTAKATVDESFFTYELLRPVQIQPGDIVGMERGPGCAPFGTPDNIMSLNASAIESIQPSQSYGRTSTRSTFFIEFDSMFMEDELIPLIQTVIASPEVSTTPPMPESEDRTMPTEKASEEFGSDKPSTVVIAAGVVGGFVGIVALVAACICVGWLTRHIQVHVHYSERKQQADQDRRNHCAITNEMLLQENTAYRQTPDDSQPTSPMNRNTERTVWLNEAHSRSWSIPHGGTGRQETISNNIAYHHGNTTQMEASNRSNYDHLTIPLPYEYPVVQRHQSALNNSITDDQPYEYIL